MNVASGATLSVTSGGSASGTQVTSGGAETLTSAGTAYGDVIAGGGYELVGSGAVTSDVTISGGTLEIASGGDAAGAITFVGSGGTLIIDGATPPSGTISGFSTGDAIVFSGLSFSGASVTSAGNTITVTSGGTSYALNLDSVTNPPPAYTLVDDGGLAELVPCYTAGTRILTPRGEVLVEDIAVGDTVVTVREGGPATRKVVWTGRRRLDLTRHPDPEFLAPIRILAGAIAHGVPERDLLLSPHHAVYLDGYLYEALALVNGATIRQELDTREVTYHHIELEQHDIMLAEGLPAESFLNTGNRDMFENAGAAMVLHPDFRPQGDEGFCVPIIRAGDRLRDVRAGREFAPVRERGGGPSGAPILSENCGVRGSPGP